MEEILTSAEPKNVTVVYKDKEYKFKFKDLSWSLRNRIISKCMIMSDKSVGLDVDRYYRMSLKEMIVEAPWELAQTDAMLQKLSGDFGYALQQFVPNPFADNSQEGEIPKN